MLACAALAATLPRPLPAQSNFTEIYAFGNLPDAQAPGGLVLGPDGALYGVSANGGAYNFGAVFRLQPPSIPGDAWTESVLHSFTGQSGDGLVGIYVAAPVFGPTGALYGTTELGGTYENGTVFELQPPAAPGAPWTEAILYSFPAGAMTYPSSLLTGSDGTLYGTSYNGVYGQGMIYALSPPRSAGAPWTEQAIYDFTGIVDGSFPLSVIAGPNGSLYGTTALGGAFDNGVLFQLTPPSKPYLAWIQTVLFNFSIGIQNFSASAAISLYSNGVIYGTASLPVGFGIIQLQPSTGGIWAETPIYTFPPNGSMLSSQLILRRGNLYGTTATYTGFGGPGPGGRVFELRKPRSPGQPWKENVLYHFQKKDSPHGNIAFDAGGAIYGTTNRSNAAPHHGYAYQIIVPPAN